VVPLFASDYAFRALIVPFLILAISAIGLNILVGYCGQISLGQAGFMAVGAYAAYNLTVRIPDINFLRGAGAVGRDRGARGHRVRHPEPAHQGPVPGGGHAGGAVLHRLAVHPSEVVHQLLGVGLGVDRADRTVRLARRPPVDKYLVRTHARGGADAGGQEHGALTIGRSWMAIRDMDVAAAVIGIRPVHAKLTAFAVCSFYAGVAGALWGFVHLGAWEPLAFNINMSASTCCS
jgi:branched-chain amino acid transport system permease protein